MNCGLAGRIALPLLLFMLALANIVRAEATMSADEFTRYYATRVEKLFPDASVTIKQPLEVEITVPSKAKGKPIKSYLDNTFKKYLAQPARIDEILDEYDRILAGDFDEASFAKREQLVAVVRHKSYMDEMQKTKRVGQVFPARQLAGDIYIFYAFDSPDTLRFADLQTIEEAGVKKADFDAVAIQNVQRVMAEPLFESHAELVAISAVDPYMTSVLLIDQFWSTDRFRFRGDLVAFVVSRDLILVTGSEETVGLEAARKAVQDMITQVPYAISEHPIVRRNGKWQSFSQ